MTHYYTATHSTGTVHLRKTDRTYTHAVVGARVGAASWAGRLDLAQKAAGGKYPAGDEVVQVAEVTSTEFARLTKASKRHFRTTYQGKVYTKTVEAGWPGDTLYPVGVHDVGHVEHLPVPEGWLANAEDRLAWAQHRVTHNMSDAQGDLTRAQANMKRVKAWIELGYYECPRREDVYVQWAQTKVEAEGYIARNNAAAFRFRELLACTEV